ncbi:MAG: hypothetical protein J0M12_08505 [Deltaproteobacteria bacterium]|nr:hypothetical protein [Deltaproteobacteria bacterium]
MSNAATEECGHELSRDPGKPKRVPLGWFVLLSALFAILLGFGLAGHLSFVLAFGYPLPPGFPALVQAHGHAQLVGWVGLVIIGISLRLLPPLLSRPVPHGSILLLAFIASGLLIRSVTQIIFPYVEVGETRSLLSASFLFGATMESAGLILYGSMLGILLSKRQESILSDRSVSRLVPFLVCMMLGSLMLAALNFWGSAQAFQRNFLVISAPINEATVDVFVYALVLPTTLLFSVKLLPLFLGLREPRWRVGVIGWVFSITAVGILSTRLLPLFDLSVPSRIASFFSAALGLTLIAFVWSLDVLTRRHSPERLAPLIKEGALRGRGLLPDNGEYGNFEWHIYAAYAWLLLAALIHVLQPFGVPITLDTIRHIFLIGFTTNLIFGVGYRLLPGLLSIRLFSPSAVKVTAVTLNAAALGRILPKVAPTFFNIRTDDMWMQMSFGLSGSIALCAVLLISGNFIFGFIFRRKIQKQRTQGSYVFSHTSSTANRCIAEH